MHVTGLLGTRCVYDYLHYHGSMIMKSCVIKGEDKDVPLSLLHADAIIPEGKTAAPDCRKDR
jgi:hypothetical protein